MCGIVGFVSQGSLKVESANELLTCMSSAISHRGPDGDGLFFDSFSGVGMAHRRLSIVDLSETGSQPMESPSKRYVIVFNGEIYNHHGLRQSLQKEFSVKWRGSSDTEVLLAAFDHWGVVEALKKASGMFALAIFDRFSEKILLARDRFGEKPLYFGFLGSLNEQSFIFGSDLASFKAHPNFNKELNRAAITEFLKFGCVPAPLSIYEGVSKLQPGKIIEVCIHSLAVTHSTYWSSRETMLRGQHDQFPGTYPEAVRKVSELLSDSVERQMLADVPIGAFLSGGIDSSLIAALMQAKAKEPIKTFSIGFTDKAYDEAEYAKKVAKHLGTDHTELYVDEATALQYVNKLASIYSEPFADSSQIPTLLVCELARESVVVSLSGDAGDELFGGYNRYVKAASAWRSIDLVPLALRNGVSRCGSVITKEKWAVLLGLLSPFMSSHYNPSQFADRLDKSFRVLGSTSLDDLYMDLVSSSQNISPLLPDNGLSEGPKRFDLSSNLDDFHKMMCADIEMYLPDDILVKVDRAAMAVSLETRVPFLDHTLFEFSCTLPTDFKYRNGVGKAPLRDILSQYVPRDLFERPKMGFGVPIKSWLRGPLREWAAELIARERLVEEGYFDSDQVNKLWQEHIDCRNDHSAILWNILMFQSWLRNEK